MSKQLIEIEDVFEYLIEGCDLECINSKGSRHCDSCEIHKRAIGIYKSLISEAKREERRKIGEELLKLERSGGWQDCDDMVVESAIVRRICHTDREQERINEKG